MLKAVLSKQSLANIFSILHCKKKIQTVHPYPGTIRPPTSIPSPHQEAYAVYFYVFPSEFPDFSPGLSPQPDNACRSAALYGSIKIPLLFAGEVKCGKCDVCGPRVVQAQCFQMTFAVPPALCFAAATYIRTSISTEAYVQVEEAETPVCTKQESCGCAA